jgi:hypothetical protein
MPHSNETPLPYNQDGAAMVRRYRQEGAPCENQALVLYFFVAISIGKGPLFDGRVAIAGTRYRSRASATNLVM